MERLYWVTKYLVPCVRPAHPHQVIVLRGYVGHNIPFAFAAVLPPHQNVHIPTLTTRIKTQVSNSSDKDIRLCALIGFDNDVRCPLQLLNIALSSVPSNLLV